MMLTCDNRQVINLFKAGILRVNDMQFATLRKAMVDSQIRPNKVIDVQVIEAFSTVPRELFVSRQMQEMAYIDEDIHLSGGRFIIEAMVMARMIQALKLVPSDNVMCIGAGTGYGAAILSSLAASVIAIETRTQMVEKAQQIVASLDIGNVAVVKSRLQEGYPSEAFYQGIIIEGGVEYVPQALFDQLSDGGHLVSVLRMQGVDVGEATLWHKHNGHVTSKALFTAQVPVLDEFKLKPKFTF